MDVFQKLKFGINLISKLGHHLQNPSAQQLIDAIFTYITEFVKRTKGLVMWIACDLHKIAHAPEVNTFFNIIN